MSIQLYGWQSRLDNKDASLKIKSTQELRFSIVIPTLNQGETLEHTLLSIINQDYMNFEIIVIDGGSTDNTAEIIEKYKLWIDYCVSGKDSGQSNAINQGFSIASGDIFAWINSDDFYLPQAFTRISRAFENNNAVDIIVGAGDVVTRDCKFLKHIYPMEMNQENLLKWLVGNWIMQQSCFWTSRIWEKSGGVDENLKLLMDFDLWFRFSKLGKSTVLNEPLAAMRYYREIKTISLKDLVKEEIAYVLAKNGEFEEVKKLVRELVAINKVLIDENSRRDNMLVRRLCKKIGISI
jgi:glycosyltransferase involved in cell wall biosynthesis